MRIVCLVRLKCTRLTKIEEKEEVRISDKFLEVNAFNSNIFNPNSYAGWEDQRAGENEKPESTWNGMDMVEEQIKDYAIR